MKYGINLILKRIIMTKKIGNIKFNKLTIDSSIKRVSEIIETSDYCQQIVVANAYSVVLAHKNKKFAEVCELADIAFADGIPVVWASKLLGDKIPERVAGPDFMWSFSKVCSDKNYKVFLMGSEEPFLSKLKQNLENHFPGIDIVGVYSPPYGEWSDKENKKIVSIINKSNADILWVGVSSPKQDIWISRNKKILECKVAIGVGAAFDFHSGRVERAPIWVQKLGFEWLFRFTQDPRRLWKRYIIGNLQFIIIIIKEFFKVK